MIEKVFEVLPDWAKNKLFIRMTYTAGSFIASRLIAFLTGVTVNHALSVAMAALGKVGIVVVIQIVSINEKVLEAAITGILMIAGEWAIQHFHQKTVLPIVAPEAQAAAKSAVDASK